MPPTWRPWLVQVREILIVEDVVGLWDRLFDDLLDDGKRWKVAFRIANRRVRLAVFLAARWEQRAAAAELGVSERTAKGDAAAIRRAVKRGNPGYRPGARVPLTPADVPADRRTRRRTRRR